MVHATNVPPETFEQYEDQSVAVSLLYAIVRLREQMDQSVDEATYRRHFDTIVTLRDHLRDIIHRTTRYDHEKIQEFLKRAHRERDIHMSVNFRLWLQGSLDEVGEDLLVIGVAAGSLQGLQ